MVGRIKYLLVLFMAMMFAETSAQNHQVLYFMNLPQNHSLNPAMRPSNSLYIGLPGISGTHASLNNNYINFPDLFIKSQPPDSIITFLNPDFNVDEFTSSLNNKNSLTPQFSVQLFGVGFSAGKDLYFFLDINERIEGNLVLPGDLLKLVLKGNEGFVGNNIDLSALSGNLKYFREIGLGFSKAFTNKLRMGVKGKLLSGIAGISIDNRALEITVNENLTHTMNADLTVNVSAPLTFYEDAGQNLDRIVFDKERFDTRSDKIKYLFDMENLGLGLDIGATYDISDKLNVSAALTDIGFIKWKTDVTNLESESRFYFSGLNIQNVLNGEITVDDLGTDMLDSLKNSFTVSDSDSPFTTWLPVGVTLGGSYNLTESFSLGILSYSRIIDKQVSESLTLSANFNLGNAFSSTLSYSIANHRFDNLGAGLAFRAGVCQLYILANRIPLSWDRIKIDNNSTLLLPVNWNTFNVRLGLNLVFGNRISKKDDKPMVISE